MGVVEHHHVAHAQHLAPGRQGGHGLAHRGREAAREDAAVVIGQRNVAAARSASQGTKVSSIQRLRSRC